MYNNDIALLRFHENNAHIMFNFCSTLNEQTHFHYSIKHPSALPYCGFLHPWLNPHNITDSPEAHMEFRSTALKLTEYVKYSIIPAWMRYDARLPGFSILCCHFVSSLTSQTRDTHNGIDPRPYGIEVTRERRFLTSTPKVQTVYTFTCNWKVQAHGSGLSFLLYSMKTMRTALRCIE